MIYAVNGGMEDWAYGGSWLAAGKIDCNPTTFGGNYAGKTHYNDATHRAINLLVEASFVKAPPDRVVVCCMYTHAQTHTYTYRASNLLVGVCVCVWMDGCIYLYLYLYLYIYTHTHTHTCTYTCIYIHLYVV